MNRDMAQGEIGEQCRPAEFFSGLFGREDANDGGAS
jgi:hypothetical protein